MSQHNVLVVYTAEAAQAAEAIQAALGTDRAPLEEADAASYEYVFLGFETQNDKLPDEVRQFLADADWGAKTIYAFVRGSGNTQTEIQAAISNLQPGALLGSDMLLYTAEDSESSIMEWAQNLGLTEGEALPGAAENQTVATAEVTPHEQQVLYLWEENNAPAVTEYTQNTVGYSDDPDFRPYITTFPVPEGTPIKGAVLICPGGAFQFRSDQPEGIDVAEALSARGYQSFVVDYRLRPYTQQEGALDLARAVRFVRAHAEAYGIDPQNIAVMGFSAGGILSGEMLLHFDGQITPDALAPEYTPDELDQISANAAACGMIYSFYGRLSVGTTDVDLLHSGELPPTFYCYGTRDPFYDQFLANADAAEEAGVAVTRILVNNAGWCPVQPITEMTISDYDRAFSLDVRALVEMTIHALPLIRQAKGSIINLSSVGAGAGRRWR